jgi:hypothetical protein
MARIDLRDFKTRQTCREKPDARILRDQT